jgi:hypothetical protein
MTLCVGFMNLLRGVMTLCTGFMTPWAGFMILSEGIMILSGVVMNRVAGFGILWCGIQKVSEWIQAAGDWAAILV